MKYSKGLTKTFLKQYTGKPVPWGPIGYITYKRTYARQTSTGRLEEWHETCARVCSGLIELGGLFTQNELEYLYDTLFHLRGLVSGRALWQLGTETVREVGADSLQNCWHVACNQLSSFAFAFNQLMLGGGVGFNILPEYVYELPRITKIPLIERVDTWDCDLIVTDNREGWVELLEEILESFFVTGKRLQYCTRAIRPQGTKISRFGGIASGSEPLVDGINQIIHIIRSRLGQKLRPIDCLDVMNIVGSIVRSGNVRRCSQIAIGDHQDREFLNAKNWKRQQIPDWRTASNNSIALDHFADLEGDRFWEGYNGDGEPYGFVSLRNCREFGRLADGRRVTADPLVVGVNPCGEITLEDREPCNLAEIVLPRITSLTMFKQVAAILFKACKTIANARYSDPSVNAVVHRNYRTGVSLTGVMEAFPNAEHLDKVYKHLKQVDEDHSRLLGCPLSRKITTIKPSGTLSLLSGCTPGIHPALGHFIYRTMRFAANNPLVEACREAGYPVEPRLMLDGRPDHSTMVVTFPVKHSTDAVLAKHTRVTDSLTNQCILQTWWSDNAVSATHYYKPEDVGTIKEWLANKYDENIKGCSFLLATDHGFKQAPIQPVSEEEYEALASEVKPFGRLEIENVSDVDTTLECEGGVCSVR
jgi:ribonucleoside-diphosphate reductase alpha chain/ribonucleoside-triphosphate reductase